MSLDRACFDPSTIARDQQVQMGTSLVRHSRQGNQHFRRDSMPVKSNELHDVGNSIAKVGLELPWVTN